MRLPALATALVGREGEVRAACELLRTTPDPVRLLTLVGAGGVGKTRLALAVASAVEADYADGIAFVDLSALRDPRLLAEAIAHGLELHVFGERSARDVLLDHLRERQVLLVLDTFEHLIVGVPLLIEVLEACPRMVLVVTSRTALRVQAEHRLQVEPLPEAAAMRLFVERARAVSPGLADTPENGAAIAQVCRQLEGIPLAIELAAARLDLLGPQQLLRRLERRLPLLVGGGADLPPRHQTLRNALVWSYDLLSPEERTLFRRLAVFESGWTLESAEIVGGMPAVLDLLGGLVAASLVRREDDPDGTSRFRMLDTIREFAADQLTAEQERAAAQRRHAAWCLELAERAAPALHGPEQAVWLRRLEYDHDNLRAALDWLTEQADWDAALRLATAATWFWLRRGHFADAQRLIRLLDASQAQLGSARAGALLAAARLSSTQGDYATQARFNAESLALYRELGDKPGIAEAVTDLGVALWQQGCLEQAYDLLAEGLRDFRMLDDAVGVATALLPLACVARDRGDFESARPLYAEALAYRRASGDELGIAHVVNNLGWLELYAGNVATSRQLAEESLAIRLSLGARREAGVSQALLGKVGVAAQETAIAAAHLLKSLEVHREVGNRWGVVLVLEGTAGLVAADQPERALRLAGAATALRVAIRRPLSPAEERLLTDWLEPARRSLATAPAGRAWAEGEARPEREALADMFEALIECTDGSRETVDPQGADPIRAMTGAPPVRARMVSRQRLVDRLNGVLGQPVVLVAAPAGFGKTTSLLAWASRIGSQLRVAWMSLTASDDDPARFWRYLLTALHGQQPGLVTHTLARLEAREPIALVVDELIRELCGLDGPLALVVDDFHLVQAREIHAELEPLLARMPPNFHLIISSRSDPPLPLARLRSNGQLLELRAADLRFTESEAETLLEAAGLRLSAEQLAVLETRTEGWAAGLQLAALFLRDRGDTQRAIAAFAGSDRLVLDYFMEEVLARLPDHTRTFLQRSSILERLHPDLCDAVVGTSGSAAFLEELERTSVFVTPVDDAHIWYRYHQLFADALRHRLRHDQPNMVLELHRRASDWYAGSGFVEEAVEHALAGRLWDRAADLIGQLVGPLIIRGEHKTLERWLSSVPDEVSQRHHVLSNYRAVSLLLSGELTALDAFLVHAEPALERAGDHPALGRVLGVHAHLAAVRDDVDLAQKLGVRALSLLTDGPSGQRTLAMTAIARGHLWRGDPGHAGQVLEQAIEATTRSVDTLARWELANVCAFRWLIEGKLYRAAAGYDQVVQAAGERLVFAREVALLGLALLAYEGNHLDQAAAHLDLVAAIRQQVGRSVIQLPFAAVLRGRVLRAQGRLDLADQAFENAEKAARHVSSTRLRRLARAERARVALGDGNLAEAARWAEEIDLDRIHQYAWEPEALMLARVRRAQVRGATVVPLLERLLASAEALGRGDSVVAILVQLSLAREQDNDHAGGLAALEEAVAFAEPAGYTRAFLDEGEPMLLQLRRLLKGGAAHGYVVGLVRAFGSAGDGATAGLEVLTPREHDVLRLLAVGLSNRAIAERLVTSEGTVKSHVHRLIAKLGVASRAQVIVRARELGTLPAVDVHGR